MASVASPEVRTIIGTKASVLRPASRLASVDVLRGLVMVIMALDHTRDFLTYTRFAPEDVAHTSAALFFTRFITHYCAPVFSFLAGTGAYLSTRRGKSIPQLSRFFVTRGLWLVLLEVTVVDFAWGFQPWAHAGVIWILGWSMVVMALIVWLPLRWIAVFGVGMIATHNLLDGVRPEWFGRFSWIWTLLHTPGTIPITANFSLPVLYVLIPWVGVMAAGFAFGSVLSRPDRRKWILTIGITATVLFFVVRGINLYGNGIAETSSRFARSAGPWTIQATASHTVISFFNALKYPPSLDYLLMTLGPALILLGLLDNAKAERGLTRVLLVFGRVPLCYYLLHLYVIHLIGIVSSAVFHQPVWHAVAIGEHSQRPLGYGHGLPYIYAMWLLAVAILYVPCKRFMEFKARHREWNWLSYL